MHIDLLHMHVIHSYLSKFMIFLHNCLVSIDTGET